MEKPEFTLIREDKKVDLFYNSKGKFWYDRIYCWDSDNKEWHEYSCGRVEGNFAKEEILKAVIQTAQRLCKKQSS